MLATGRLIPQNETVSAEHQVPAAWYAKRFGESKPDWYVFPAGKGQPNDPTRPVSTLTTACTMVRTKANVVGRWHDNRHTLVTELAESGAGDEVIMSIAGHVSRAMLSLYSHVRMEAKRRALDESQHGRLRMRCVAKRLAPATRRCRLSHDASCPVNIHRRIPGSHLGR
jgi:integrase